MAFKIRFNPNAGYIYEIRYKIKMYLCETDNKF